MCLLFGSRGCVMALNGESQQTFLYIFKLGQNDIEPDDRA